MGLTCGATFAKWLMITINIIFWLAGAGLLACGLWLLLDDNPFKFLEGSEMGNPMDDPLWSVAIYVIIGVGAFVFLLGFLGCCGACTNNQCMIFLYIVLVSIVLVAEVVGGILMVVFASSINESVEAEMKKGLVERYQGEDFTDGDSTSWNNMQQQMECCGATDFRDYQLSAFYNRTKQAVPYTCCVLKNKDGNANATDVVDLPRCVQDAKDENFDSDYLHTDGCYKELKSWLDDHSIIIIAVAFGFVAIQIIGLIIACCLRKAISQAGKAEMV